MVEVFDYSVLAARASALVTRFGRTVTFLQLNPTPADPAMPWRGATDPEAAPPVTQEASAVFVAPASASALGMSSNLALDALVQRSQAILIAAAGAVPLENFQEVVDGNRTWRIVGTEKLQPGNTALLYFVGLAGR